MIEYKSSDTFVGDRGKVFLVKNDKERKFTDFNKLIGEKVIIDDDEYIVKGFEKFCIPIIRKGEPIGILV